MNYTDLEKITDTNQDYRRVITTTPNLQLVVMNLHPLEEIGIEKHHNATQFLRIESGTGIVITGLTSAKTQQHTLKPGIAITIPPNTYHNIIAGNMGLKLYTIYSPPQHPPGLIEKFKV